jgi:hypothetical protein
VNSPGIAPTSALSVEDAAERVERFLTGGSTSDPVPAAAELASSLQMSLSDWFVEYDNRVVLWRYEVDAGPIRRFHGSSQGVA